MRALPIRSAISTPGRGEVFVVELSLPRAREGHGWRIDYFLISDRWRDRVEAAPIHNEIFGSDHCPIGLTLKEEPT